MKNILLFAFVGLLAAFYSSCQKDALTDAYASDGSYVSERGGGRHGHHFGDSLHHACDSLHNDSLGHPHHPHDSLWHDSLHTHHPHDSLFGGPHNGPDSSWTGGGHPHPDSTGGGHGGHGGPGGGHGGHGGGH